MKTLFTILALIASVLAIIFSVLPLSNLAVIPAVAALVFGIIAFYLSKKAGHVKKIIQFSFLLTIMALGISTYKSTFEETKVSDIESIKTTENKLEKESIKALEDIEIDESE